MLVLVDTAGREQGEASDILTLEFMTVLERLFAINQGNVCSDTFHQTIFSGERGFENCTDNQSFFAWGTESPAGSGGGNSGSPGSGAPGGGGFAR